MRAIVFGGAGFLGSHVADELTSRSHEVVIFDAKVSPYLQRGQMMVQGDILDFDKVREAVKGCDVVYNFAGVADIDEARQDPLATVKINVIGNAHLLEASKLAKVKRFVFASSVYVYTDLAAFYRSSKQSCELIIEDYQKTFGLDFTVLRYGSLYGRRSNGTNFIARVLKQAIEEGKIVREGRGEEVRDYIHVVDAARCSVDILDDQYKNQHIIITGTQSMKVATLLEMISEIFNNKVKIEYVPAKDLHYRYKVSPYTYQPKLAKKLVLNQYHDLGQGLLDVIHELHEASADGGGACQDIEALIDKP
jgi:UDP-glucose 4-epimerase